MRGLRTDTLLMPAARTTPARYVTVDRQHSLASDDWSQCGVAAIAHRNGIERCNHIGSQWQDFPDIDPRGHRERHWRIRTRVGSCLGGNGEAIPQRAGRGRVAGGRQDIFGKHAADSVTGLGGVLRNRCDQSVDARECFAQGDETRDPLSF
jgi:hypothetical protein